MAIDLPAPESADATGLVFVGGDLAPDTVVAAYRIGLFPWRGGAAVPWYSPDPSTKTMNAVWQRVDGGAGRGCCDR